MVWQWLCVSVLFLAKATLSYEFGDDDGAAFNLTWTEEDAKNCPILADRDVSMCKDVKVGDVLSVPALYDCMVWLTNNGADVEAVANNPEYYCRRYRHECHETFILRLADEEVNEFSAHACANSFRRLWRGYAEGKTALEVTQNQGDDRLTSEEPTDGEDKVEGSGEGSGDEKAGAGFSSRERGRSRKDRRRQERKKERQG